MATDVQEERMVVSKQSHILGHWKLELKNCYSDQDISLLYTRKESSQVLLSTCIDENEHQSRLLPTC